ncbi:MAG: hypothetical protein ACE5E7_14460 [Anaerolineae bacterium]
MMSRWSRYLLPAAFMAAGILFILLSLVERRPLTGALSAVKPTRTVEPLLPTQTRPILTATAVSPSAALSPTPEPGPTATAAAPALVPSPAPPPTHAPGLPPDARQRFGVAGQTNDVAPAVAAGLPIRAFYDWRVAVSPPHDNYWQTIRVGEEGIKTDLDLLAEAIAANPGAVWMIGNEPDVKWQDNVTPERYAVLYHDAYAFIKARDPSARVAIGGVAQSTPLRRAYLDVVLDSYRAAYGRPMPVDVWTIHAYTLREEAGSWGVDIPPGMDGTLGRQYEIADHGDLNIFSQNLIDFRAWMAERGYQERPLAVTEFGIIMPPDYGFPPEMIAEYMAQAFDFLLTAANETGYPADGGRLVQQWFWYSLYDSPDYYPSGNLFDRPSGQLTFLGRAFAEYVKCIP